VNLSLQSQPQGAALSLNGRTFAAPRTAYTRELLAAAQLA